MRERHKRRTGTASVARMEPLCGAIRGDVARNLTNTALLTRGVWLWVLSGFIGYPETRITLRSFRATTLHFKNP